VNQAAGAYLAALQAGDETAGIRVARAVPAGLPCQNRTIRLHHPDGRPSWPPQEYSPSGARSDTNGKLDLRLHDSDNGIQGGL
jgi:hypothetical protein